MPFISAATVAPGLPGEFYNHHLFLCGDVDSVCANTATDQYTVLKISIIYPLCILCVRLYPLICILSYTPIYTEYRFSGRD